MTPNKIAWIAAVLCFAVLPALAQSSATYIYTPLGFQQISPVASGTVLTVPSQARIAQICVENNEIRYRDDGTAPTTTVGMPVSPTTVPTCFQYSVGGLPTNNNGNLSAIQFIQVISPATLDISYYR